MVEAERPVRLDVLRTAGVAGILAYEIAKHAPGPGAADALAHRAALAGSHGFALLVALAAFAWAQPILSSLDDRGPQQILPLRFAFGRLLRLAPAYLAVAALTIALPLIAHRYGFSSFAHATLPPATALLTTIAFAGNALGNDAFWLVSIAVRLAMLFPFALALYVRAPRWFALAVGIALALDLFTVAHRFDAGAVVALAAGIVAADPRLHSPRTVRAAAWAGVAFTAVAFALDPFFTALPAARFGRIATWSPLWLGAIACALLACRRRSLETFFSGGRAAWIGASAFAVTLVAEPVSTFALRTFTPSLGVAAAAAHALVLSAIAGYALYRFVDRRFADGGTLSEAMTASLQRLPAFALAASPKRHAVRLETPAGAWLAVAHGEIAAEDLASVVHRMGSAADLASEMQRAAQRSADCAIVPSYVRYADPVVVDPIEFETFAPAAEEFAFAETEPPAFVEPGSQSVEPAVEPGPQREPITVRVRVAEVPRNRRPAVRLHIGPTWGPHRV